MPKLAYTNVEIGLLADGFKKSPQTISRWIKKKHHVLTSDFAKEILKSGKAIIAKTKSTTTKI